MTQSKPLPQTLIFYLFLVYPQEEAGKEPTGYEGSNIVPVAMKYSDSTYFFFSGPQRTVGFPNQAQKSLFLTHNKFGKWILRHNEYNELWVHWHL